jgi:4-hydroxymandelate oxidase
MTEPTDVAELPVLGMEDFEARAQALLDRTAFDYIAGGAGEEVTLADNVRAWARRRLLPRVLRDVSTIDTATTFLGQPVRLPLGSAPMAYQHFAHADAEPATARATAVAGGLYCLSTMSSRSLEDVAAAADEAGGGPRWFQLYVHHERALSADLVARAEAAGYGAIVLTVDLPVSGVRLRDERNRMQYPQEFGNFVRPADVAAVVGGFNDTSLDWDDVAWLRGLTRLPLVIKGVLAAADAALAAEHGAAGVVVSNHGGRQLDRTPATADVLAEVVDAVAGRAEVYVDGGIRRGVDVLTALALGARGAFVGRPLAWALAADGENGVARAWAILEAELQTDMALLGVRNVGEITRDHLRPAAAAGP